MNSETIIMLMTNLINKKFYKVKEEAVKKLDVYFALNRIDEDNYTELTILAETVYTGVTEDVQTSKTV